MDPIRRLIQNRCEILNEPAQGGKNGQQGLGRCRFDDQPVSLLAHDGVLAGELELPRNPHSPVSPILKDLHVSFGCDYSFWHMSKPMPILGLCQWLFLLFFLTSMCALWHIYIHENEPI